MKFHTIKAESGSGKQVAFDWSALLLLFALAIGFHLFSLDPTLASSPSKTEKDQLKTLAIAVTTTTKTSISSETTTKRPNITKPSISSNNNSSKGANYSKSSASKRPTDCFYEKGPWEECRGNVQKRTLKLKLANPISGRSNRTAKCDPIKIVRRECKLVGCKYMRGQWSANCTNGLRFRIDTLVPKQTISNTTSSTSKSTIPECQPVRKVVKGCKRACHYIKNAWGPCVNGFRTRNLTLQESPTLKQAMSPIKTQDLNTTLNNTNLQADLAGSLRDQNQMLGIGCAKKKVIRKKCRSLPIQTTNS